MTSFRMALVGCGTIAPTHADALADLPADEVVLTTCADNEPAKAASFARQYDLDTKPFAEILRDPRIDGVTICTPSGTHAQLAIQALQAGKHVIVEKPMDITAAACHTMIQAAAASECTLSVISQHRFDPASLLVKQHVQNGTLGRQVLIDARVCWYRAQSYYDSGDWRGTWALDGGGCLMNQGIHTVDLMLWMCGPVRSVHAEARTSAHSNIEVEDNLTAVVTFASGAIGTLVASTSAYPGFPARLAIHGTNGSAVIEGDQLQTLAAVGQGVIQSQGAAASAVQVASGGTALATDAKPTVPTEGVAAWGEAHRAQLANFVYCCCSGDKPVVAGTDGLRAVEFIQAVYQSASSRQTVYFPGFAP